MVSGIIPVAGRRSGRQRPRYSRAEPAEQEGRQEKFFRKLLKGLQYVPRVVITDKLRSYGAAKREILLGVEHRQSRYLMRNRFGSWAEITGTKRAA